MTLTVLVTDPVAEDLTIEAAIFATAGIDVARASAVDAPTLAEEAACADAILVTYASITAAVIAAATRCKIISRVGIGTDNVDIDAATRAGMYVTNVPDYCLGEVADHATALLLAGARGIVRASAAVRQGAWDGGRGPIHRLRGRRLALIGAGAIGRRVAERAQVMGITVVAFDPYLQSGAVPGLEITDQLEEAIGEADFVSLHAPLTAATRHIMGEHAFSLMRRGPLIVNTARGGLIDHDALIRALDSGQVGGAALDVTEPEPLPSGHPLRDHPRAIVTSHMAYYSVEAEAELRRRSAQAVVAVLTGGAPTNPVNQPKNVANLKS